MNLGEAAEHYASEGIAVLPLRPGSKQALLPKNGRDFSIATTDVRQVRAWWRETPEANIGVRLAASSLVVVDVDVRDKHPNLGESLNGLCKSHGPLPPTLSTATGGGGVQLFYRAELDNPKTSKFPSGEFKATGYVVAPPSMHPSGEPYVLLSKDRFERVAVAPAPDWLVTVCTRAGCQQPAATPAPKIMLAQPSGVIPEGSRANTLMSMGGSMLSLGLSVRAINAALEEVNRLQCSPPVEARRLEGIVKNLHTYEVVVPRTGGVFQPRDIHPELWSAAEGSEGEARS